MILEWFWFVVLALIAVMALMANGQNMRGYDFVASHAKHEQKRTDEQKNAFAKLHEKNLPTQ